MTDTTTTAARPVIVPCAFCATRNRVDLARHDQRPRCGECHRPILLDRPVHVGDADLDEVIRSSAVPIVIDFYADWCGPCHATAPALDELAGRYAGRILVTKVDTDRHPEAARRFGVRGIPTLVAFHQGRETRRHVGVADLSVLKELAGLE